jgi:hypothetical protein
LVAGVYALFAAELPKFVGVCAATDAGEGGLVWESVVKL